MSSHRLMTRRPGRGRLVTRWAAVVVIVAGASILGARPAAAEDTVGPEPTATDERIEIDGVPDLAGLDLRAVPGTGRLELTNTSDRVVVVLDYQQRPYLRVGPDGVFENADSPAVVLNRFADPDDAVDVPPATERVRWRRLSGDRTVRWFDHRTHVPPSTASAGTGSDGRMTLLRWTVPVEIDGRLDRIDGTIDSVPGPGLLAPTATAAVAFAAALLLLRRHPVDGLAIVTVATGLLQSAHVAGQWIGSVDGLAGRLELASIPLLTTALLAGAAVTARSGERRGREDAERLAAGGATVVLVGTALGAGAWLIRSQFPSALATSPARLVVAALCGLAAGTVVWGVTAIVAEHDPTPWRVLDPVADDGIGAAP